LRLHALNRRIPAGGWMMIIAVCIFIAWLLAWGTSRAGPFQDARNFGAAGMNRVTGAAQGGAGARSVPGFTTANPPQTSSYGNAAALSNAASGAQAADASGAGNFIQHSAATRPQFNITAHDPLSRNAQSIQKNAQALVGLNTTSTSGACRNVTTTTPDIYSTFTCSAGQTSDVFSSHICTSGRTPDVFSNHACTSGRTPDIFRNYACTRSRPTVFSSCDRVLSVTATSRPYCYIGQTLTRNTLWLGNPWNHWVGGTSGVNMGINPVCGAPGGWPQVRLIARGDYSQGSAGICDYVAGWGNGHRTISIHPWPTGWTAAGSMLMYSSGWCYPFIHVYYTSQGCNAANRCAATFYVDDGSRKQACPGGSVPTRRRYGRGWRWSCPGSCHRAGRRWICPSPSSVPDYKIMSVSFTRNHNIVTFRDQWVNQTCR